MKQVVSVNGFTQKCGGGRCPKVLLRDNGDALVQGIKVEDADIRAGLNVPDTEEVVFLPSDVVREFVESYSKE